VGRCGELQEAAEGRCGELQEGGRGATPAEHGTHLTDAEREATKGHCAACTVLHAHLTDAEREATRVNVLHAHLTDAECEATKGHCAACTVLHAHLTDAEREATRVTMLHALHSHAARGSLPLVLAACCLLPALGAPARKCAPSTVVHTSGHTGCTGAMLPVGAWPSIADQQQICTASSVLMSGTPPALRKRGAGEHRQVEA